MNNNLSLKEKLGFGTFACTYNLTYYFKASYYLFFLTNVLGIGVGAAGSVIAIGAVWDAINDPLIGFYTANHPNKKGERVRNLIPFSIIPVCVCLVLLFTNFHVSDSAALIISAVTFFVYDTFYTCLGTVYSTMNTVATDDQGERTSVNIHRSIGSSLGTVIGVLAIFPVMSAMGVLDEDGNLIPEHADKGFFTVALLFGGICAVGSLIHYFTTKERIKAKEEDQKVGFIESIKDFFTFKPIINITIMVMLYNIVILFLTTDVVYYATYVTGSTAMSTYYQGAFILGQLLSTIFLVKVVDKKLGHNKTLYLGLIIFVICKIPFAFDPYSMILAIVNFAFSGIGAAFLYVIIFVQISNACDLIEWKTGKRTDAFIGSIVSLVCTMASAIATEIIALVLAGSGFDAELAAQPSSAITAINAMMGIAPLILSAIMLLLAKKLNLDKEMDEMNLAKEAGKTE